MGDGDKNKAPDHLGLLKEQYRKLQIDHTQLRHKYDILNASSTDSSDSFPSNILRFVKSLKGSDRFSDVSFVFSNGDRMPSHRLVIAARTSYWKDLDTTNNITIGESTNIDAFRLVYNWMYTDEIEMTIGDQELLDVCRISCVFQLISLQNVCVEQLSSRLDVTNCVSIYEFAEQQELKVLRDVCGSMIAANWDKFGKNDFIKMPASMVYNLLDKNTKHVLHSIIDIGREDVLFLFFMAKSSKLPGILNDLGDNGETAIERALLLTNTNNTGFTLADQLVKNGADLNRLDSNGESVLMRIIRKRRFDLCDYLIENGADAKLSHPDKGYNLVHVIADMKGDGEIALWVKKNLDKLDINKMDYNDMTPLMEAAEKNNVTICEELITGKADISKRKKDGTNALSICLLRKDPHIRIAELLLSNGADVNCKVDNVPLINLLIQRKDIESVSVLLSSNVDVEISDENKQDALHTAAICKFHEVLSRIVESRRGLKWKRDHQNRTALDIAIEGRDLVGARIIVKGKIDVNERDPSGYSLLAKSIQHADDDMAVFLIDHGAKPRPEDKISNRSYLEHCCKIGLINTVRALLLQGSSMKTRCSSGYSLLECALISENYDVAELLVSFHCDMESVVRLDEDEKVLSADAEEWSFEQTLLHHFINERNEKAAIFLIENGSDVNAKKVYKKAEDDDQMTPCHMAVLWGQNELLKALIDKGADLNAQDVDLRTPCHVGVRENNINGVQVLLNAPNVDFISMRDKFGHTILSQAMVNKNNTIGKLIVDKRPHAAVQTNGNGENLLHSVIKNNDFDGVLFLLGTARTDPKKPVNDGSGKTPLHLAATVKNEMILRNLLLLVSEDVNLRSTDGCTPLQDAIKSRNALHASILIENGADPNILDEYGENAMHCAVRSGSIECIRQIAMESNCDRHAVNNLGCTTLHICAMLSVDRLPHRVTSAEICETLLKFDEPPRNEKSYHNFIDSRDLDGNTALMVAYSQGNALVCRSLLKRRACMGTRNNAGVNVFKYETATKQLLHGLLESLECEPRWSDADTCDCGTKFSLTQRKHHCRHCGLYVCSKCSETTMPIAKYGEEKRVRLCDLCAHIISTGTAPRGRN